MQPASQWESEGDCLYPLLLLTARKHHTPSSSPVPRHVAKLPLGLFLFSCHQKKTLYPINLLAIGYLRSIMLPEKEQAMKVPFGLTSNVFLDELQPSILLGNF